MRVLCGGSVPSWKTAMLSFHSGARPATARRPAACATAGEAERASAPNTAAPPSRRRRRLTSGLSAWGTCGCGMAGAFLGATVGCAD